MWSPDNSLTLKDIADLQRWGMNVMRLSIMWPGIFPNNMAEINDDYLNKVADIVNSLAARGIYTILNLHQDLLSNYFCGEGLPDYLVRPLVPAATFPYPLRDHIQRDPDGHPNITVCKESVPIFGVFYFAQEVGYVMKQLYVGTAPDGKNSFVNEGLNKVWQAVAGRFKDNENVLGLELLNEPFAADIYTEPAGMLLIGHTGRRYLTPLYRQMHDTIRTIDSDHILFFDPSPIDALNSGLTEGPGGKKRNNLQAYSYHIYCPVLKPSGAPIFNWLCAFIDKLLMWLRMSELKSLGCGGMLTEFGALDESPNSIQELELMTELADDSLQGWVYSMFKQYKDITTQNKDETEGFYYLNGTLQEQKVRTLTRTYAPIVAGLPLYMHYDPSNGDFELRYKVRTAANLKAYTDIFMHVWYHYPYGYTYTVKPIQIEAKQINPNILRFVHPPTLKLGTEITIQIHRK